MLDDRYSKTGSIYIKGLSHIEGLPEEPLLRRTHHLDSERIVGFDLIETHDYQGALMHPAEVGIRVNVDLPNWAERISINGERKAITEYVHLDTPSLIMPARIFNYCMKHGAYLGNNCPYKPPHD